MAVRDVAFFATDCYLRFAERVWILIAALRQGAECSYGPGSPWCDGRNRGLQGARTRAVTRQGRARGDADPDGRGRDLRDREDLRGARQAWGAARAVPPPRPGRPGRDRPALGEHARETRARTHGQRAHTD